MHSVWPAYLIYQKIVCFESLNIGNIQLTSVLREFLKTIFRKPHFVLIREDSLRWCEVWRGRVTRWAVPACQGCRRSPSPSFPASEHQRRWTVTMACGSLAANVSVMTVNRHLYFGKVIAILKLQMEIKKNMFHVKMSPPPIILLLLS